MDKKFIPYGMHSINESDIEEVVKVLRSGWIIQGEKTKEFEQSICNYIGCSYAVAVNSGTSALDIALTSLNLEKKEVITTPMTFVATSNAILYNNLKPVFADIKSDTHNIDPEKIREKITDDTGAIVYVDYAGQPCDIKEIKEISQEFDLLLIEDAAQSLGAKYEGKRTGTHADVTTFSFHPVKHITTGEGGMCVTNRQELYEKMLILREHGIERNALVRMKTGGYMFDMTALGRNYRITDFQSALGNSQLKRLDSFLERREQIARTYIKAFENIDEIINPVIKDNVAHSWHIFTIMLNGVDRDKFFELMREDSVGVNVHHVPPYDLTYYKQRFKINPEEYPVTEKYFKNTITIPLFPAMSDDDVTRVIESVKKNIKKLT